MNFSASTASRVATAAFWAVGLSPAVFAVFVEDRVPTSTDGTGDWGAMAPQSPTPWRLHIGLAYAAATIALLLGALVLGMAEERGGPRRAAGQPLVAACIAMYMGPVLSGAVGAHGGATDWRLWLAPLSIAAVYASPAVSVEALLRRLRTILRVYTWGSLCALVIAPDWALTPNDIVNFRLPWVGSARLEGMTDHPILLGVLAATVLAVEVAPLYRSRWWVMHAAAAAAVLLLAQSRTAWLAALVGLPLLYQRTATRRVHPLLVRGLTVGMICCAAVFIPSLAERIGRLLSDREVVSLHGRTTVWNLAMSAFRSNPVFGYGPTLFTDPSSPVHGMYAHAHSQYYQTLGTSGLVGATGLLLFVAVMLLAALRTGAASAGLSWSLVAITLVTCLAEAPLRSLEFSPFLLLVVTVVGVLVTVDREIAAEQEPTPVQLPAALESYGRSPRSAANNWSAAGSASTTRLGSAG